MKKIIIHERHKNGCSALRQIDSDIWDSPWFITGDMQYLAKDGSRRGRSVLWQPFRCNSIDCGANGIVSMSWLETIVFISSESMANPKQTKEQEHIND